MPIEFFSFLTFDIRYYLFFIYHFQNMTPFFMYIVETFFAGLVPDALSGPVALLYYSLINFIYKTIVACLFVLVPFGN